MEALAAAIHLDATSTSRRTPRSSRRPSKRNSSP
jgi:hypothetical protein